MLAAKRFYSSVPSKSIGFIGLGNMGGFMAVNLIRQGHKVTVFDSQTEVAQSIETKGGIRAKSIKEVGENCDIVVTMLPTCPIVSNVCLEQGLFDNLKQGSLVIDSSTINPSVSRDLANKAKAKGIMFLDAPVSGGVTGAENATLTFMVGGSKEALNKANPILEQMGKNIVSCGDNGSGLIAKVCNNMLLGIQMVGVAEAMNLGNNLGMDVKVLANIVNTSTGRCWASDTYNPVPGIIDGVPSSRKYEGGFGCSLMLKELKLALESARETNSETKLGNMTAEIYDELCKTKYSNKDFGAIYDHLCPPEKKVV